MDYLHTKKAKQLFEAIALLQSENEARKFLGDLLTKAEITEFSNRWAVAQMLNKSIPYETITQKTHMSSTTIARIQKWLNGKLGGYRLMLNKLNEHHLHSASWRMAG